MDVDDVLFDASTPDSDEEDQHQQLPEESSSKTQQHSQRKSTEKVIRRRARKACVECHKRKVRCDVLSRGSICTNCRLDGLQCVLRAGGGRRRPHGVRQDSRQSMDQVSLPVNDQESIQQSRYEVSGLSVDGPFSQQSSQTKSWPFVKQQSPVSSSPDMMYSYYDFIEAESFSHLASDDFKFLEFKGCFHLPAKHILDKFVEQYFKYVHPALPLVDEREFFELYEGNRQRRKSSKKVPLFLFRCMLFASASFLPPDVLIALGYNNALKARNEMYQRAKMLYDFNTITDSIGLAQGAVLLTYYCSDREPMANTTWLRLAIQYAMAKNAHLYYKEPGLSSEARLEKKRLWWCCVIRDRILPLGVRRPIQITHDVFDFSQPPLSERDLESEADHSRVYDQATKKQLGAFLIALMELAVELTDIMPILYPIGGTKLLDQLDNTDLAKMPSKIQKCRDALERWSDRAHTIISSTERWTSQHKSVYLFSELTQIYFQSARAAVCQHESFTLQMQNPILTQERMRELGGEIHSVIASISESVGRLVRLDLAQFLPVSLIAYMALPIILNSIDVQGANATSFKNESKRRQLRLYNEAMDFCSARYSGATGATDYVNKIIAAATQANKQPKHTTPTASTALMRSSPNEIDDWFGIFVNQPLRYLRITLSIDMSMANGRYPQLEELPRRIMLEDVKTSPPILRSLTPPFDERRMALVAKENSNRTKSTTEVNLDFFDFGTSSGSPRVSAEQWTEQSVERILEEVLGNSSAFFDSEFAAVEDL